MGTAAPEVRVTYDAHHVFGRPDSPFTVVHLQILVDGEHVLNPTVDLIRRAKLIPVPPDILALDPEEHPYLDLPRIRDRRPGMSSPLADAAHVGPIAVRRARELGRSAYRLDETGLALLLAVRGPLVALRAFRGNDGMVVPYQLLEEAWDRLRLEVEQDFAVRFPGFRLGMSPHDWGEPRSTAAIYPIMERDEERFFAEEGEIMEDLLDRAEPYYTHLLAPGG
jgi:hypothetical protein